jgi:lysophospholipase L1-like esterase
MSRLRFIALALVLLLASARPAVAAEPGHNFAQWEKEVAAYESQDRIAPPPKGGLLFAGSSTIRMWTTLAADFPRHSVINRGFGGTQIVDCTYFADRLIFPHAPKAIFLRAGTNDIHAGKTPEQVFADFQEFVATIHARLPDTEIWFISLCPTLARISETSANRKLNELVADYARRAPHIHYIDTWSVSLDAAGNVRPELFLADRLHFNAAGYKILAERVRPYLR